jgi:O-antigen ligase
MAQQLMIEPRVAPLFPERTSAGGFDAVTLLTIYIFFLMAIPSRLVFAPLGGAGAPSTVLGVVFFAWYMFNWIHPSSKMSTDPQPIRRAAVLFLCAILASYVAANLHTLPSLESNGADRGIILTFGWLGVMLIAADGISSLERLKVLLRRLVFGASAMSVLGIWQFFTGLNAAQYFVIPGLSDQQPYSDIQTRGDLFRPSATAIHPIEFGFVLAALLPFAIHQARYAPPGKRGRRWFQVALMGTALPMTVSRSAILGLLVCLIALLSTWTKDERRMAYLIIVSSLFVLRAVIHGLVGTLRDLFLSIGSDSSTLSRTSAFGHAAPLLSAHPFLGQGFGTFLPNILFYTDDQYLNSLIEIGAIGTLVLIVLFVTGWLVARSARRKTSDPETRHLMQCLAASMGIVLVTYATFDALYFPMAASLSFLLAGCAGAGWRLLSKKPALATYPDLVPSS